MAKSERIFIRLDEAEKEQFKKKTKENGTTPSKVLIEFITKYNNKK